MPKWQNCHYRFHKFDDLEKRVAIQIQLMNIHVSENKYHCLHLVPKLRDVCGRQNWRLHPTAHCEVSHCFKGVRLSVKMSVSFWNLTGTSAAVLPRCLSNSERSHNSKYKSCGFQTFRDLAIRRLIGYWYKALGAALPGCLAQSYNYCN